MVPLPMVALAPSEPMSGDEAEITFGLVHCHNQMNALAQQIFNAAAEVRAVTGVLQARGLIGDGELATQRADEERRLRTVFQESKVGVRMSFGIPDKYTIPAEALPQIDCASRLDLCHAACCALRFPLTRQDLEEGVMRWELGEPYLNRQGTDGLCVHLNRAGEGCSIYGQRPGICRVYDCRQDSRIWLDFEQRIINPELFVVAENGERRAQFVERDDAPPDASERRMDQPHPHPTQPTQPTLPIEPTLPTEQPC